MLIGKVEDYEDEKDEKLDLLDKVMYKDEKQEGVYHSMRDFDNEVEKAIAEGEMNRFDARVKREYDVVGACKEIWDVVKTTCEAYCVTLDEVAEFFRKVQDDLCEEMERDGEREDSPEW